jgi:Flp pilus assembly protein TadD
VTFPELEPTTPSAPSLSRTKRTLTEQAIAAATGARWDEAADVNRKLLEYGPEAEAENRLAKALWELGDLAGAR